MVRKEPKPDNVKAPKPVRIPFSTKVVTVRVIWARP
jgi:hypothetical protein